MRVMILVIIKHTDLINVKNNYYCGVLEELQEESKREEERINV